MGASKVMHLTVLIPVMLYITDSIVRFYRYTFVAIMVLVDETFSFS